ncbi:MAG TPA: hypothetical protein VL689_14720 [Paraburkholderia sp.]|jgi:hypothetical protein|nr:hypothetical protein [Paraburkholderia sp.]
MKPTTRRHAGVLMMIALALTAAATGGCERAEESAPNTAGVAGPVGASGAGGALTGPAVTPAPAPPRGAKD